jgi:hypothetical protein
MGNKVCKDERRRRRRRRDFFRIFVRLRCLYLGNF